jgi:molybdenum cofactor cytidylyltransferase
MGRPKLLLPWGGATLVGRLVEQWKQLGARQVSVVIAKGAGEMEEELLRLGFSREEWIENPHPEKGMFSSLQAAAVWGGWRGELSHFIVQLGDQPLVRDQTLKELIEFAERCRDKISQPELDGRPKHPVVLPALRFRELNPSGVATFREYLEDRRELRAFMPSDDRGLAIDVDTPQDYEKAFGRSL